MSGLTELHRHLDVSVRGTTLLRLAQERGLESQGTSLDAFLAKTLIRAPMTDLQTVLDQFSLFQKVLDRPDVLEQVAAEVIEDCWNDGIRGVELRFSPTFVCELSKLKWEDALDGFEAGVRKGLARFPGMRAGLICIASRDYGVDACEKTVEFFLKHQSRFIGFDLAGNETDYPCRLFEKSFQRLRDAGAKITVHAGEATGPDNMWEAIELLGARRIGHGVACVRDPKLMEYLRDHGICLENCPTSNWLTQTVPSLEEHPLPKILRAGVPVSINTDDPGIFAVTLSGEIEICRTRMGLNSQELELCQTHAARHSFL